MIKKAVAMRKHLEANRKDKDGARGGCGCGARCLLCCRAAAAAAHCSPPAVPLPVRLVLTWPHPLLPPAGKFHLILVESRIHRLARYYKSELLGWPAGC